MATDSYQREFTLAWQNSLAIKTISPEEYRIWGNGVANKKGIGAAEPILKRITTSTPPYGPEVLRTNCTGAHFSLMRQLHLNDVPCLITIGDVIIDGVPRFHTDLEYLGRELSGENCRGKTFDAHVWLTFPDGHILDATICTYMLSEKHGGPGVPARKAYNWHEHLFYSNAAINRRYSLEHKPILVGARVLSAVLPNGFFGLALSRIRGWLRW